MSLLHSLPCLHVKYLPESVEVLQSQEAAMAVAPRAIGCLVGSPLSGLKRRTLSG